MQGSYPMSWKDLYLQTLLESNEEKLTELVHATEQAIVLRRGTGKRVHRCRDRVVGRVYRNQRAHHDFQTN
jgi:hypothetical protein